MKKIVSIMASIFMALALIGGGVFLLHDIEKTSIVQEEDLIAKATTSGKWENYTNGADWVKDSDGYIKIQTPQDLAYLASCVNSGSKWDDGSLVASSNFRLYPKNDEYIDLSAHYWAPIGNADHPFKGVFDGNGKQIIGLNIDYTKSKVYSMRRLGLFGHTDGGVNAIKDLTVSGEIRLYNSDKKGSSYVGSYGIGGIVGVNFSPIKNCVSNVNIYYVRQSSDSDHKKYDLESHVNIGGIAGWSNLYGNITNCTYSGEIHFNDMKYEVKTYDGSKYRFRLGGIAGCAYNTDFKDCLFNGKILVHEPDDMDQLYIGGIVACYNVANAEVSDCISKGEISLDGHFENQLDADNDDGGKDCAGAIGGVVGYVYHNYSTATALYIKRCHNFSKINQYTSDYSEFHVGGILGYTRFNTQIYNCSNLGYVFNRWQRWESVYLTGGHIDYNHWIPSEKNAVGTGGIVGTTEAVLKVYYCINYGNVSEDSSDVDKGKVDGSNSFNKAVLSYGTGYIGGILGHKRASETSTISYCMNYGSVSSFSGCSTIGTLFGYLKGNVFANHCLSFVSGNICGSDSAVKPGASNNCDTMTSPSRDDVLNRKNNNSTASFWSGKLCTYYPNVSGDSLNDKLYISPKDNESLIYKHLGTGVTANAIMPLSLISKTTVTYYCGADQKFYQNDENVGRSQRGDWDSSSERYGNALSTYIDRDPDSDYSYPDRIITLRGVGVSNEKIFTCSYYKYDTKEITKTDSPLKNNTEMSVSVSGDNIKASVCGYTYNLGTITIKLKPKQQEITVSNSQQGTVTIGDEENTAETFPISVDKYTYNPSGGGTSRELSVTANKTGYVVKSISFNSTAKTNTSIVDPFTAKSAFTVCDISTITINYVSDSQNVNFYYKLPSESSYINSTICDAGGVDISKNEDDQPKTSATINPDNKEVSFKYNDTIFLYTNPGYYIKNIWAKHRAENWVEKDEFHTIDGERKENKGWGGIIVSVTWEESTGLSESSLQTFLQNNFFNTKGWDISAVYIQYDYTQFNTSVYVDGSTTSSTDTSFDLSKTLTVGSDKGIELGYEYGVSAGKTTDALTGCFNLGVSTEASPHSTSLNLDENKNAQISIKLSDFVGTSAKIYTTQNTGSSAYSPTAGPLYIYLNKQDSGVQLKVADKNMAKYAGKTDKYYQVTNPPENPQDKDIYKNPIGGLTSLSSYYTSTTDINSLYSDEHLTELVDDISIQKGVAFILLQETENYKKIQYCGKEYFISSELEVIKNFFSAIAMPGFKFVGIDFTYDGKTTLSQTPYEFSPLATAIDVLAKAVQDKFGTKEIYYDQLNNLTVYGYYDIGTYKIETYKQVDNNNKEIVSYDASNGYFSWTEGPHGDNKKILFYFYKIEFELKDENYKKDNLEFLGLYLLNGTDEKLLTLDTTYTFVNYNSSKFKNDISQVEINFLVKFATKPTSSSTPSQSNQVVEVSSAEDLIWLSNEVNTGNTFENYIIKQTANIDFQGKFISPIGTAGHPFKGTYDGQGYVIKNLSLTNGDTAIGTNVGLFGYTYGATIKNLTLVGGSVTGFDNVGAVVGYAKDTTFENVINQSCKVKAITYAYYDIYGDEIEKAESFITDLDSYSFEKVGDVYKSLTYYKNNRAYGGIVGRSENSTFFACGVRAEISNSLARYSEITKSISSTASTDPNCQVSVARGIIGSAAADSNTKLNQCYYFGDLSILSENYLTNQGSLQNCIYRNGSSETPYNADTSNTNIWFEIDGKHELKIFYWA